MLKSFAFVGNTKIASAFTERLVEAGFEVAERVEQADAVLVYCESQTDLEDVFFDTKGLIQTAPKGSYLIDLSASTPGFARELNAVSTISDLHTVEAPLVVHDLVSDQTFSDRTKLSCFIAGEQDDIEAVKPFLSAIVSTLQETGMPGSAQMARAAYTIQSTAQLVALIEIESLYRAFDGSGEQALTFTHAQGLIASPTLRLLKAIQEGSFSGAYTIQMWMAELTAALMTADDIDLILPGAEACMHLLELLAIIGGAGMAPAALSLVYGEESQCAKYGLDWTRAEQSYGEKMHDHYDGDDYDRPHDDFPGSFGSYSSN